jgi:asparaginyl-tRNA synthetase
MRIKIKKILPHNNIPSAFIGKSLTIKGWIKTIREQKTFSFIEINDGSSLANLQVVANSDMAGYQNILANIATGASVAVTGVIQENPTNPLAVELHATEIAIIGKCPAEDYPLQKKRHSFEFLRTIAHLRPRTNTLGCVARVRNALAWATHKFFQEQGFLYVHTPIITASDCEGAGAMFQVTTLDLKNPPKLPSGEVDYQKDFFEKPAFLTVSGQLNGEIYACALSDIYTFGPTFRAENSNTSRHLAEFWMIEPEMAFADINDNMDNAESYLKYVFSHLLNNCEEELSFFEQFISKGIIDRLKAVVETPFERTSYTYAIRILERSGKTFEFAPHWGCDLQSEHERYLCEEFFQKPVIVTDYPKEIKSFYMRENSDNKTVAAMDILVPKVGELVGGSQREERLSVLEGKMKALGLDPKSYWWYLELRKYGSVPHAGYGVGFERLIQFATGVENIREVIPFPRYPGSADF